MRDPVLGSRYRATLYDDLYDDLCRRVVFTEELCTPTSVVFIVFVLYEILEESERCFEKKLRSDEFWILDGLAPHGHPFGP